MLASSNPAIATIAGPSVVFVRFLGGIVSSRSLEGSRCDRRVGARPHRAVLASALLSSLLLGIGPGPFPGSVRELVDEHGHRFARFEASGMAYFRGKLIIVDDTLNSIFVFDRTGTLSQRIEPISFPKPRAKFEAVAADPPGGRLFILGSHTGWDRESLANASMLLRLRLEERGGRLVVDDSSVVQLPLWRSFERLGLWTPGGMNVEGLAYDPASGYVYVGLREPSDRARIYRLQASLLGAPESEPATLEEVVSFDAGELGSNRFGISDLLWIQDPEGLLILTSMEDDTTHAFPGNRLWYFSETHGVRLVLDTFDPGQKAEGLALGEGLLFISYDNDQDDTGLPSELRAVPWEFVSRGLLGS
jgi:hypothetical protein